MNSIVKLILSWLLLFSPAVIGQLTMECPATWEDGGANCYKFFYELPRTYDGAKSQCFDVGSALVSVEDDAENNFITVWLGKNDQQGLEWYTSGKRKPGDPNAFIWEATGQAINSLKMYWAADANKLKPGTNIIYKKTETQWGWDLVNDTATERAFMCEVAKQQIAQIVVTERDWSFGQEDMNNILKGPKFVVQPPREVIFTSAPDYNKVSFECLASGNPAPSYKWLVTAGGVTKTINTTTTHYTLTNGKLVIHNPSTDARFSDVGSYQCIASNLFGSVLGDATNLVYGYIGEFSKTVPKPLSKLLNEDANIPCNAPSHYPEAINYRWFKGQATNFVRPDLKSYLFISKNGNLYFSRVKKEDEGPYYCSVSSPAISSGVGQTSVPTQLLVNSGASDTRDPRIHTDFLAVFPANPMMNDNVTIECFAAGTGELVYNWKRLPEDRPMPITATMEDHNRVLKIQNVRLEDAGTYQCTVSMGTGSTMSKSIPLSLQSIPYFTKELEDHHVDQGQPILLHCEADGKPRVTYSWFKNGVKFNPTVLMPEDKTRIKFNNTRVIINDARAADEGMYQCAATNLLGTAYTSSQVRVLSLAPTFVKYPMDPIAYAALDGNVTLRCTPEASPEPERKWFKDGNGLVLTTDPKQRVFQLANGNLMINNAIMADEGQYTCKVVNKYGAAESSGRLIVLSKTTISIPPLSQLAVVNATLVLDCEASVHPSLDFTYLWFFNDYPLELDFNDDRRLRQYRNLDHYNRGSGARWGDLVISNVSYAQAGIYTCMALTPQDSASKSANITVVGPPGQPAEVYGIATSVTATSITLRWAEANPNGNIVLYYTIEGRSNHRPYWHVYKTNVLGDLLFEFPGVRETFLDNLNAWSSYKFRVIAVNDYGPSEPSTESAEYTTAEIRPLIYPRNIRNGIGKEGTLVMAWDGLHFSEINGPGMGYVVEWRPASSPDTEKPSSVTLYGNTTSYTVTIGTRNYFLPYNCRVSAFNTITATGQQRFGDPSPWTRIMSADKMPPSAPLNPRGRGVNSTCLEISWTPVNNTRLDAGGIIVGYRINYWKRTIETEAKDYRRQTLYGQLDRGRIIGLEPNTYYSFNTMVFNSAGNGPRSSVYEERTWRMAPQDPPRELTIDRTSDTSIYVTWRGVGAKKDEEPVEGYMIRNWPVGDAMTNVPPIDTGFVNAFELKNLETQTRYYIRVFAYSRGGHGKMSSPMIQYQLGPGPWLYMTPLPLLMCRNGRTDYGTLPCNAAGAPASVSVLVSVLLALVAYVASSR